MAKKVRFRLWFHKLNIKRFSNTSSHPIIKRRSIPHPLDILGFPAATSAPPFQARHSSSSPDHISVSATLLSSPSYSLPVSFSSPSAHTFSSPRHSLPGTSLPRHRRNALKPSKHQANFSSAVLLSPINCKALDIPYPSGGSSPAFTFMQSPTLQAAIATSPGAARIFSPPILKPQTVRLFRSPLHPLAYQNSDSHSIEAKTICTTHGTARSSRKAEIPAKSGKSHADCLARQSRAEEEFNLITAKHTTAQQRRSNRTKSHVKQSPLIVDCGCHPSFSSSFRKTRKTLQACGSCSSNKPGIIPVHNNLNKDAMQKHDMLRSARGSTVSGEESKNSMACISFREDTCPVSAKQDYHSQELSHKKLQLKKRKKRMEPAELATPTNPKFLFKQQEIVHTTSPLKNETIDEINRETKTKKGLGNADCNPADGKLASSVRLSGSSTRDAALPMDARTLAWEKDFSSFTSEDTFFSSFERSRPSFSSNSSSECFDKKLSYSKLAFSHANVVSNDANVLIHHANSPPKRSTDDLNCSNTAFSSSNSCHASKDAKAGIGPVNTSQSFTDGHSLNKLQRRLRSMNCKGGDPLIEVSFHAVDVDGDEYEVAPKEDTNICKEPAIEHTPCINANHGMKRSNLNPLVEIKEDSCEDGDTDTVELDKILSSRKCRSSFDDPNLQKKLNLNADYTSSSHSDYYANAHADLQRRARVRKKSDANRSKGRDTGSARLRRRAHLQARWRLSDEQIHWQSSVDDEDVDHDVGCTALTSQPMYSNSNDHGYMHTQNNFNRARRRRARDIKQKHTEMVNASMEASKAALSAPQNSALRTNSHGMDDSAPCGAAEVMLNTSDNAASKCEAERVVKTSESLNVNRQSSYATNPRLIDSVAVVKCSKDPLLDFRESMVDMIIEKQMYSAEDLGELLQCFLSLNSREHHDIIVQAFAQVWGKLFHES